MKTALLLAFASFAAAASLSAADSLPPLARFSVENMDRTVDPGTDFYRFANGTWLKEQTIPADQVTWSPTARLIERNAFLVREILESCSTAPKEGGDPVSRQLGDFYASAMETERIEKLGFEPIAADLKRIAGISSREEFSTLLADFHSRGIDALFDASVSADERNSGIYAFQLGQGGIGLPERDYYLEKKFAKDLEGYRAHIARMLKLLGEDEKTIAHDVKAILGIETALARASKKLEDLEDPISNYHKLTLQELGTLTPSINWPQYLEGAHAAKLDYVLVGQPEFFKAASALLKNRPLDELKSYLRWHVLVANAPLLHEAAEKESFSFYGTVLRGQPKMLPRWKRAARRVDESLGEALGKIYVDRHFPALARERMNEMVKNIEAVYHDRLTKVPWMSEETRKRAVEKFDRFTAKIGAPAKFRDYSTVEVRRDDYVGNVQRAAIFEARREMGRIGAPVDRSEWGMTPPTVNAYFNATMNEIVFPAGILQPPFFDPEIDDAVNYGETGATIGHEMTHGYDSEGRKYDAEGNLKEWWTDQDAKEFDARARKLVEQFNSCEVLPGLKVNGKLTLAENIADLGGLSIAFEALERALAADPSKRKTIDGYTPEQRFFIAYAQSWAAKERDEYVRQALTTDTHSPDMLRGVEPLLNLQEFYDAFDIKETAPLFRTKEKRAVIW
ncbi:MAG: Neprilysin [Chthoniobacteraceae bacterium]|nr:Neprilysin [Chthoniobacteraceae bacterium]